MPETIAKSDRTTEGRKKFNPFLKVRREKKGLSQHLRYQWVGDPEKKKKKKTSHSSCFGGKNEEFIALPRMTAEASKIPEGKGRERQYKLLEKETNGKKGKKKVVCLKGRTMGEAEKQKKKGGRNEMISNLLWRPGKGKKGVPQSFPLLLRVQKKTVGGEGGGKRRKRKKDSD